MNDPVNSTAPAALRPRLLAIIGQLLEKPDPASIPVDAPLAELGMSSIKMVNLMLAVEVEFDLSIPTSDITPDTFRTVSSVEALLTRLLAAKT
jgi:acyl carrier protein